jgi:hypothetical protein
MRGLKAKNLRRMAWTQNSQPWATKHTINYFKRLYSKGVPITVLIYYPRQGQDWRKLLAAAESTKKN